MHFPNEFSPKAAKIVSAALQDAKTRRHQAVQVFHLAARLFLSEDSFIQEVCQRAGVEAEGISKAISEQMDFWGPSARSRDFEPELSKDLRHLIETSLTLAKVRGDSTIDIADLFIAFLSNPKMQLILPPLGIDSRELLFRALDVREQVSSPASPLRALVKSIQDQINLAHGILMEARLNLAKLVVEIERKPETE